MKLKTVLSIVYINLKHNIYKLFNKKITPYKILINLTDLCNSKCNFCDIWKIKPKNEITMFDIKNSLKGVEDDIYWVALSGGEVSLVKYFYELIDFLKENCKNLKIIAITTNSLTPNRTFEFAKYIQTKEIDTHITISLDGDEKIHDKIRGVPGNYKKCEILKKKLDDQKISNCYGLTVSDANYDYIMNSTNELKKFKAVTFVHSEGIYAKENISEDTKILDGMKRISQYFRIKKLQDIIEYIHIKIAIKFLEKQRKKNILKCDVLNSSVHIMPNGDLKPCMFMESLGNIKSENINKILSSEKTFNTKKLIKENKCPKCWMNCYSPHSIMQKPIESLRHLFF